MSALTVDFFEGETLVVFPKVTSDLEQALSELKLNSAYPVIVLTGGGVDDLKSDAALQGLETIIKLAQELNILVICGGTDFAWMDKVGRERFRHRGTFPLIALTLEELTTWPGRPQKTRFLLWRKGLWPVSPQYPYFILVPGRKPEDETSWVAGAANFFSKGFKSMTILINGGETSRRDVELSLEAGRPVLVLSRTGHLADEISGDFGHNKMITVVPGNAEGRITETIRAMLKTDQISVTT